MALVNVQAALLVELLRAPGCGLDLIERLCRNTNGVVDLKQANVYPAIVALLDANLVAVVPSKEPDSRRRRTIKLTGGGKKLAVRYCKALAALVA